MSNEATCASGKFCRNPGHVLTNDHKCGRCSKLMGVECAAISAEHVPFDDKFGDKLNLIICFPCLVEGERPNKLLQTVLEDGLVQTTTSCQRDSRRQTSQKNRNDLEDHLDSDESSALLSVQTRSMIKRPPTTRKKEEHRANKGFSPEHTSDESTVVDRMKTQKASKRKEQSVPAKMTKKKKKNRGRPSSKTATITQLLQNPEEVSVRLRFGFHEKHPQSKSPKTWPNNETKYASLEESNLNAAMSFSQLEDVVALIAKQQGYSVCNGEDAGYIFVDKDGTGDQSRPVYFTLSGTRKFMSVTGDQSLSEAIRSKSKLTIILDDLAHTNDDTISDEDPEATSPIKHCHSLVLDLFVWVKKKSPSVSRRSDKSKDTPARGTKEKYNKIQFGILPIVEKDDDGRYSTSDLKALTSLTVTRDCFEKWKLGQLRYALATRVLNRESKGYTSATREGVTTRLFGARSAIFVQTDLRFKSMEMVTTMDSFIELVSQRANKASSIKTTNSDKILTLHVALGKKKVDDEEYDSPTLDEQIKESQSQLDELMDNIEEGDELDLENGRQLSFYNSPERRAVKKSGSKRGASSSSSVDVEQFIKAIYTEDEQSPYYHGMSRKTISRVRQRLHVDSLASNLVGSFENSGIWPTPFQLFGDTSTKYEKYKYRPDSEGNPPEDEDVGNEAAATPTQKLFADAMSTLANALSPAAGKAPSTEDHHGSSIEINDTFYFRFYSAVSGNQFTDVLLKSDLQDKFPDGFTGRDVISCAMKKSGDRGNRVFDLDQTSFKQIKEDKTAKIILTLEPGPQFDMDSFFSLDKPSLMPYFQNGHHKSVQIKVSIEQVVKQHYGFDDLFAATP